MRAGAACLFPLRRWAARTVSSLSSQSLVHSSALYMLLRLSYWYLSRQVALYVVGDGKGGVTRTRIAGRWRRAGTAVRGGRGPEQEPKLGGRHCPGAKTGSSFVELPY